MIIVNLNNSDVVSRPHNGTSARSILADNCGWH